MYLDDEKKEYIKKRIPIVIAVVAVALTIAVIVLSVVLVQTKDEYNAALDMTNIVTGSLEPVNEPADINIPDNYLDQLSDNIPNGKGKYEWNDNSYYDGEWKNGAISGKGIFKTDKCKLEGNFVNNKLISGTDTVFCKKANIVFKIVDGTVDYSDVTVLFDNDDRYCGEWNNGINGKGTAFFSNGDKYVGDIKHGVLEGTGTYTWTDGEFYEGAWKSGKMNGSGTYYYSADKSRYISGEFSDIIPSREMKYKYKSHEYKTKWNNGKCNEIVY